MLESLVSTQALGLTPEGQLAQHVLVAGPIHDLQPGMRGPKTQRKGKLKLNQRPEVSRLQRKAFQL